MKAPPFSIAPGTELRLHGQLQVVESVGHDGAVVLKCPLRNTKLRVALTTLVSMRMTGVLQPVLVEPEDHRPSGQPTYTSMTDEARARVVRRIAYGRTAAQLYPVGPANARLASLIADVARQIGDQHPPSPHSVYRWMCRFVRSGYDTSVFMQDSGVTRKRRPRKISENVRTVLREHIQTLLGSSPGATLNGVMNLALARTARDIGHPTFISKEGVEEVADLYIRAAESRPSSSGAKESARREQAPQTPRSVSA